MKAFRFKLERILALRKHKEREWELKLAGVTGDCVRLRREIDERRALIVDELAKREGKSPDAGDLRASHLYSARLEQESDRKLTELASREREREKVQADYLLASRDRKVLDKLKDKQSAGYLKEQRVEEVKQIDDINTGRAARRG